MSGAPFFVLRIGTNLDCGSLSTIVPFLEQDSQQGSLNSRAIT